MNIGELIDSFNLLAHQLAEPRLWDETEIVRFANLAVKDAAERGLLIEDDTTAAICDIALVPAISTYALDPRILRISRARTVTRKQLMFQTSREQLDRSMYSDFRIYGGFGPNLAEDFGRQWDTATGSPRAWLETGGSIRVVPIPTVADTLHLSVYRLPLSDMVVDSNDQPEIRSERHYDLLDGMLARAYGKHDSEAYDPVAAAKYEERFTANFGVKLDANVRRKQRESRSHVTRINW